MNNKINLPENDLGTMPQKELNIAKMLAENAVMKMIFTSAMALVEKSTDENLKKELGLLLMGLKR